MKTLARTIASIAILLAATAQANTTQDQGRIVRMYSNASDGSYAIQLSAGLPNATAAFNCSNPNGWATVTNKQVIAMLLLARAQNSHLSVNIDGCSPSGLYNIGSVYLDD